MSALTTDDLMIALRYALQVIDRTAQTATEMAALVPAPERTDGGMPATPTDAARMAHAADLRGLAVLGTSNVASLRAIVEGDQPTPWFDPIADIRARLG